MLAFQKVNRLSRDGATGPRTRAALTRPVRPHPRYRRSGDYVEINLTRQVLYFARNGHVTRILDVSTGSGRLYTVEGRTHRAVTPVGTFHVYRKLNAWRKSKLGLLYRPAYFRGGYAIHGSYSVPAYPASHGCVRMTIRNTDRYYSALRYGMVVSVYR